MLQVLLESNLATFGNVKSTHVLSDDIHYNYDFLFLELRIILQYLHHISTESMYMLLILLLLLLLLLLLSESLR